jgi:hypothetical protein
MVNATKQRKDDIDNELAIITRIYSKCYFSSIRLSLKSFLKSQTKLLSQLSAIELNLKYHFQLETCDFVFQNKTITINSTSSISSSNAFWTYL